MGRRRMRSGRQALRVKSGGREGEVSERAGARLQRKENPERDTWRKRISKQSVFLASVLPFSVSFFFHLLWLCVWVWERCLIVGIEAILRSKLNASPIFEESNSSNEK